MKRATLLSKWSVIALVLALCAGVAAPIRAQAQDTLAKIRASHRIVMGFFNEPPHNWLLFTSGKYEGIDYDIAQAILNRLGVTTIDQIAVDWPGLIPGLQDGRWDMLAVGMSITPARAKQVAFTKGFYEYGSLLIVPKGNPEGIHGEKQFAGKKIGAILGGTDADQISKVPGAEMVPFKSHPEMVNALKAGRIDAAMADETTAGYAMVTSPEPTLELVREWDGKIQKPSGFAVRLEDKALLQALNDGLDQMKKDGSLLQILEKYGLSDVNLMP